MGVLYVEGRKRQSSEAGSAHRAVAGSARTSVPTSPYRQGRGRQRESTRAVTSRDFPGVDTKKPETTGSAFTRSNGNKGIIDFDGLGFSGSPPVNGFRGAFIRWFSRSA